jgi:hypothetical protein
MTDLIVKFERIGRSGNTPEAALTVHVPASFADDEDRVADYLYAHCKRHLVSREFTVSVDLEIGEVRIDGGRFGKGEILVARRIGPPHAHQDAPCTAACYEAVEQASA